MNIKSNKTHFLIEPADLKSFVGVENKDTYVLIDRNNFSYSISPITEDIVSGGWTTEELDGRKLRKVKKQVLNTLGDLLLSEYKNTNRIFNELSSEFINVSGVSDIFKNALSNDMNLILFGKGGFGKSEMCNKLFNRPELRERVFVQSLSEATTEEDLFGGIKMKKFMDTGEKEFLVENSFANKEIVIFEEIFDANPRVLAALKDTLTSKEVRNGNQRFPIKTKIIIGLTNKTYDEVIEDDSTEALTQRFPISFKLEYALTKLDAASLILKRYPDFDLNKVDAIVNTIDKIKDASPRKVLEMAKYIRNMNIRKNKSYSESITNNGISGVIDYLKHKTTIDLNQTLFDQLIRTEKNIRIENAIDYDTLVDTMFNISNIIPAPTVTTIMATEVRNKIKEINDTILKMIA